MMSQGKVKKEVLFSVNLTSFPWYVWPTEGKYQTKANQGFANIPCVNEEKS